VAALNRPSKAHRAAIEAIQAARRDAERKPVDVSWFVSEMGRRHDALLAGRPFSRLPSRRPVRSEPIDPNSVGGRMLDQMRRLKTKMDEDTEITAELDKRQAAVIKEIEREVRARDKRRQAMARLFPPVVAA
jgi:hypothetical protein